MAGDNGKGDGTLLKVLGAVVALVTIAGGGATLLFHLRPGLQPCIGGANAVFTGAPVFPRMYYHDHLRHEGLSASKIAKVPNFLGAEVRFSYRASNLKSGELPLYWSLVTVGRANEPTGIVADRRLAMRVKPDTCTETGGKDLFVLLPDHTKHYRVVLELYRNQDRTDRLALFETPTFRG